MNKIEKIEKTLKDDKIFLSSESVRYKYYICKGVNGRVYDVIYYKGLDKWKCDCDNIRKTPCYHIETAKAYQIQEDSKNNINYSENNINN